MTAFPQNLDQQEAAKLLSEAVKNAWTALSHAESIADHYKLSFRFDIAYGMGGRYEGNEEKRYHGDYDDTSEDPPEWYPSSMSC